MRARLLAAGVLCAEATRLVVVGVGLRWVLAEDVEGGAVVRLALAVDGGVGVAAGDLAVAWERDGEARSVGSAVVEPVSPGVFLPGLAELVVVPLVVNLASSVVYDLVKRLVESLRSPAAPGAVEVIVRDEPDGDRLVVVRIGGPVR